MKELLRRCGLGVGAALLIWGWETIWLAKEQQQAFEIRDRDRVWVSGFVSARPSRKIHEEGTAVMALGAGVLAFSWPRRRPSTRTVRRRIDEEA